MKKIMSLIGIISAIFMLAGSVSAQGMMGGINRTQNESDGHTAKEEAEGKAIFAALQAKETACDKLTDGDFGALGEYFMGTMLGSSHEAMNVMMQQMMGNDGEEQMHVVMGKRLSGCDPSAQLPTQSVGFLPMMSMMFGGRTFSGGFNQWTNPVSMMSVGLSGWSWLGSVMMIFWWGLIIVGIVALVKWLANQSRGTTGNGKAPLEILKERYAKGEIDNKEFEEKKKILFL